MEITTKKGKIAHFCCLLLQAGDDYQYVYDTSEVVKPEKSGQRLIGASRGEHTKIPFIVVWHSTATDEEGPNVQCSGKNFFINSHRVRYTKEYHS